MRYVPDGNVRLYVRKVWERLNSIIIIVIIIIIIIISYRLFVGYLQFLYQTRF